MLQTKNSGIPLDTKDVDDAGVIEGYASIFGNVDSYGEIVEAGAFIKSLEKSQNTGRKIKMLWQHDPHQPIGVWDDLAEDKKGLRVRGRLLIDQSPKAREAHGLLQAGALDGLSIGYRTIKSAPKEGKQGIISLTELDLLENSVVTFAANERARVESVKATDDQVKTAISWLNRAITLHEAHMDGSEPTSAASQMKMMNMMKRALGALSPDEPEAMPGMGKSIITVREFEEFLRDAGGFSKSLAVAIAAKATPHLRGEPEAKADDVLAFLNGLRG